MSNFFKEWLNQKKQSDALPSNQQTKRKQRNILTILGVVVLSFLLCTLFYQKNTPESTRPRIKEKTMHVVTVDSATNSIGSKEEWLERAQVQLNEQQEKTNRLNEMTNATLQSQQQLQQSNEAQKVSIDELMMKIAALEETIENLKMAKTATNEAPQENLSNVTEAAKPIDTVQTYQISLTPAKVGQILPKTPKNYIPLGSHVAAILIGGVDVSAAVTASASPRVVYMRTQGDVRLPGNKTTPLRNCYILGSSWGDVSSERAYVRLARMSCERKGVGVEYDVKGNVFGPDGREGIRGKVVMRDGALVGRAFLGGLISGLGETYSSNYMDTSTSVLGSVQTIKNGAALQYGAGQGMQKAADMYADYNIRRAEQYQPVIEVSAGTIIDIVFAEGFYVDGEVANEVNTSADDMTMTTPSLVNNALQLQAVSNVNSTNNNMNAFP